MLIFPMLALVDSTPFYSELASLASPQIAITKRSAPLKPTAQQVPFYSQFADISSSKWQKVGCGITSLAMIVDYYHPNAVTVNALLAEGIKAGAYTPDGWSHQGLVTVSRKYGMAGQVFDLSGLSSKGALAKLESSLSTGPVIASVHYKFQPTNPIPHLVVVTSIAGGYVYVNDPAAKTAQTKVPLATFAAAWKQRYIAIYPAGSAKLALAE